MSTEKEIIETNRADYIKLMEATPVQYEIQRHLRRLDDAVTSFECRWGIGRLPLLAGLELAQKWDRQLAKLDTAVLNDDLYSFPALVDGAIRGLNMLEDKALAEGAKPIAPEVWEMTIDGSDYRVYQTRADVLGDADEDGVTQVCLEELLRLHTKKHEEVYQAKPVDIKVLPKEFFDKGGDDIGF